MPSTNKEIPLVPLPEGFTPGDQDVVIGKGKKFFNHAGNRLLREIIASKMDDYSNAQTKPDKSNIISDVVAAVRQSGSFVKKGLKTDGWFYAEDLLCREKASQCFRDALHQTYRSSNVAKKFKRIREQEELQLQQQQIEVAHPAKRMRRDDGVVDVPVSIASHMIDWEMPAMPSMPTIPPIRHTAPRRSSGLAMPTMSVLMDTFGFSDVCDQGENPFEPTPLLHPTPQVNINQPLLMSSLAYKGIDQGVVSFDPMVFKESFQQRRNSIFMSDDISVMSGMDEGFNFQQYQQSRQYREQEGHNVAPNAPAAFAA